MDEFCSSLDPISTLAIEDLIAEPGQNSPLSSSPANMQQVARLSDQTAFNLLRPPGQAGPSGRGRRH